MEKSYIINNISEYLNVIRENDLYNCIYRGQNEFFRGIEASGFRPYQGGFIKDTFYDIEGMSKDYYKKVIRRLTADEKTHFLAFCQHHSLPTNLIDFTNSPLVALFFACSGKVKTDITSAFAELYFINKKRLIDITDILIKYNNQNFFETLAYDSDVQRVLLEKLELLFLDNKDIFLEWIMNLVDCYEQNGLDLYGVKEEIDEEENELDDEKYEYDDLFSLKNKLGDSVNDQLEEFKKLYFYVISEIEDERIVLNKGFYIEEYNYQYFEKERIGARIYLALLVNILQIMLSEKNYFNLRLDIYFTYQPPDLFDRIVNQKGLFIYQPYLYFREKVYNSGILIKQSIIPDLTISILEFEKILGELDHLSINLESIYGDFDNVAKSIKYKNDLILTQLNKQK